MKAQFKIDKSGQHHVTSKYMSNGHWLVAKSKVNSFDKATSKQLATLLPLAEGRHYNLKDTVLPGKAWDLSRIIPSRDGYVAMPIKPIETRYADDSYEVKALVFSVTVPAIATDSEGKGRDEYNFKIGVQPKYAPLLLGGHCFAKDSLSPILVLDSGDIETAQLVAVVMPMRC